MDGRETSLERIGSAAIVWVAETAVGDGNAVVEVADWSKTTVVHMRDGLSAAVRAQVGARFPALTYYEEPGTPHNAADEGYVDGGFGVSFPRAGKA
ncbi:MAG: hypothetical protein EON90_03665 [Brevundimonas sp.]|nr:MAG: hypothetical protein EON90_03665 [Brevundimonas sp.]